MKRPAFFAILLLLLGLSGLYAAPAMALCVTPAEVGSWHNVNPDTRGITRANIRFQCQDQILNGQPYPPGKPFYIRLFGKCHPTDCAWAEAGADSIAGGWKRGTLDQGFAVRTIRFKTYPDGRLRVLIDTDFRDPARADYRMDEWLVRS
jgi:hypothetical protein